MQKFRVRVQSAILGIWKILMEKRGVFDPMTEMLGEIRAGF